MLELRRSMLRRIGREKRAGNLFRATLIALTLLLTIGSALGDESGQINAATTEIDRALAESWESRGLRPGRPSGDSEFFRRAWLDLVGVAPPVSEIRRFLSDEREDKRSRLVDRLIASPRFSAHLASRWAKILTPEGNPGLRPGDGAQQLHTWLERRFRGDESYDRIVAAFLTAGGSGDAGPAVFYTSRDLSPEKLASSTARIFMGIQLQCAQCHDHPYDRWTQEDFWHYAAFFSQLQNGGASAANEVVVDRPGNEIRLPGSDRVMEPRYPGVAEPPEPDPEGIRRRQLAIWMASRNNPYLAQAAVNRVWSQLFGRGFVEPVDAMDAGNAASHPELLDFLSRFLVRQGFDLRSLYAAIAKSQAYGLSSVVPAGKERPPSDSFAVQNVKTLSAEQYFDTVAQNVFRDPGITADETFTGGLRSSFVQRMRARNSSPRDYPHGVVQVLSLMSGREINAALSPSTPGLLMALEAPWLSESQQVEHLFLATVSRSPTAAEADRFTAYLSEAETLDLKRRARADLLWVLLNAAEFAVTP